MSSGVSGMKVCILLAWWVAEATGLAQGKESGLSHCLLCSNSLPVFVNPLAGTGPECDSDQPGRALLSLKEDEAEREREREFVCSRSSLATHGG